MLSIYIYIRRGISISRCQFARCFFPILRLVSLDYKDNHFSFAEKLIITLTRLAFNDIAI